MKNAFFAKIIAFLLVFLLLLPATALAQGELSISADNENPTAGDTVEITLTLNGMAMSAAEGTFTYDATLLAFEEGDGGVNDGALTLVSLEKGGTSKLTARIVLKARQEGTAEINFAFDKIINYKGESSGTAQAALTLNIAAAPPVVSEPPVAISYALEGVKAENVYGATEDMFVWRSIENVTVPSRYSESTYTYKGETVAAAIVEESDAPILLYVTDDTGEIGGYYIFDEAKDMLYPYQTISSVSKSYIILIPDETAAVPEGFAPAKLNIDDKEYDAWKGEGEGIYLVYARSPKGEVGFYIYNTEDSSLQRYSVLAANPLAITLPGEGTKSPEKVDPLQDTQPDEEKKPDGMSKLAFVTVCIVAALLALVLSAVIAINARREKLRRQRAARRRAQAQRNS